MSCGTEGTTIEVSGLSHTYPDGTRALNEVSFAVERGESVALVGPNGAGKSTLLLHLIGLIQAKRGAVSVGGIQVVKKNLREVRRSIGYVFQDPDDQLFMPTVRDDVAFGPNNLGLSEHEVEQRVRSALERVNALALAQRPPHKLSAGEKRSVAIATVLAMEPDVLVMDEPTASLDPRGRRRLIELLSTFGHTKIIATHDLDFALDLCGRVIVLFRGRIAADGTAAEIFQDDALLYASGLERPLRMQGCPRAASCAPDA